MALSMLFFLFRNPLKCHKCSKKWRNKKIVSRNSSFVHLKGIQIFITACKSYKKTHYYHQHNHKESTIRNQYHGKIQLYWSNIFCDTWKHFSNNILHKNSRVFVIVVVSLVCHVLLVSEFYYIPSSISDTMLLTQYKIFLWDTCVNVNFIYCYHKNYYCKVWILYYTFV